MSQSFLTLLLNCRGKNKLEPTIYMVMAIKRFLTMMGPGDENPLKKIRDAGGDNESDISLPIPVL
ncbi:hypothetical protein ACTXT7_004860 [Hymenolepis weldensis]